MLYTARRTLPPRARKGGYIARARPGRDRRRAMAAPSFYTSPQVWLLLFVSTGVALMGIGTWQIASTCYHPAQSGVLQCSRRFAGAENKWSAFSFVFFLSGFASAAFLFVRMYQAQCGGQACADIVAVLLGVVVAAVTTAYAAYVDEELRQVATSEDPANPACIVCPSAGVDAYYAVLWIGTAVAWAGVAVAVVAAVVRPTESAKYRALLESLRAEENDGEASRVVVVAPGRTGAAAEEEAAGAAGGGA